VTASGSSRVRDAAAGPGAGAGAVEDGVPSAGKAPGIPSGCCDCEAGSGTTPPRRLPEPAKPLRGVGT
jgi:hypothetical protein